MKTSVSVHLVALWAILPFSVAQASVINETEANGTKGEANLAVLTMANGSNINGTTTGSSTTAGNTALTSADTFLVSINDPSLTPGIYRHRLVLTSQTAGHTGSIRGLSQTNGSPNAGTDFAVQNSISATSPPRFNQFYGFGNPSARLYYRVTGTTTTTQQYRATLETVPVTPVALGTFNQGSITITSVGLSSTDSDLWVYDSTFNAISDYGNDDTPGSPSSTSSTLTRVYSPGTYYLGITNFNFANHLGSPVDDNFRGGNVLDFPGFAVNSSTATNQDLTFSITDGITAQIVTNTKVGPYDINWFRFQVVPEPSASLLCLLGISSLLRRRR